MKILGITFQFNQFSIKLLKTLFKYLFQIKSTKRSKEIEVWLEEKGKLRNIIEGKIGEILASSNGLNDEICDNLRNLQLRAIEQEIKRALGE